MRVDNGEPFGSPSGLAPPPLALWLIGQGVKMIWNKPACPQQNGVVEKLQHTTARWAEIATCGNTAQLAQRLGEALRMQREAYPVSRLEGRTRLASYPGLLTQQRAYKADAFAVERVWAFVHSLSFVRRLSNVGVLTHFNQRTSVGKRYAGLSVTVRLTATGSDWQIWQGETLLKSYAASNLCAERVVTLTVMRKNEATQT
jgi:hypothetical protein